jgi:hypothetical protein
MGREKEGPDFDPADMIHDVQDVSQPKPRQVHSLVCVHLPAAVHNLQRRGKRLCLRQLLVTAHCNQPLAKLTEALPEK